jgi:hypothetical protein
VTLNELFVRNWQNPLINFIFRASSLLNTGVARPCVQLHTGGSRSSTDSEATPVDHPPSAAGSGQVLEVIAATGTEVIEDAEEEIVNPPSKRNRYFIWFL